MISASNASIGLILLLIGYAAAGPESDLRPRAVRSSACQEHTNLHSRLDVVEKADKKNSQRFLSRVGCRKSCGSHPPQVSLSRVEDTVDKLEVELAALLEAIDAPQWHPLLDSAGKTVAAVDILEEPRQTG